MPGSATNPDDSGHEPDDGGGAFEPTPGDVFCTSTRPVEIMPAARLAEIAPILPRTSDAGLSAALNGCDTVWYDRESIVPGYQDSWGDAVTFVVGFRPNTIRPSLIVDGGHELAFASKGFFHFPFGVTGGADDPGNVRVVDFWVPPRDAAGELLPVTWWWHKPNGWTWRIEWAFPVGTVFGEVLFLVGEDGEWYAFEVRTRRRTVDRWVVDAFRPFPTAAALAGALADKREERVEWQNDASLDALAAHLASGSTLQARTLSTTHFPGSFPAIAGAVDELPAVNDPSILTALLRDTPFVSARGVYWKQQGPLGAWAASTQASVSIVPRGYKATFLAVDEETCDLCHRDAGRPFQDFYQLITAYGEMWGEDETFSWHPFDDGEFLDATGDVKSFNDDNRVMRQDLIEAGLLEKWSAAKHPESIWKVIPRSWKGYEY